MLYQLAAEAVLLLHLAFIVFVMLGALLVARWRWMAAVHLPAAAWGVFAELTGRICPLTYLENGLRLAAGQSGYAGSFIEHYLLAIVYPDGLTRNVQLVMAAAVVAINVLLYGWVFHFHRRAKNADATAERRETAQSGNPT